MHSFKSGDVVVNSWGYDQTNVDFYTVEKVSKCFVWMRAMTSTTVETGFMTGHSTPNRAPDQLRGPLLKRKAVGNSVSSKFGSAEGWDGRPMRCSWYA